MIPYEKLAHSFSPPLPTSLKYSALKYSVSPVLKEIICSSIPMKGLRGSKPPSTTYSSSMSSHTSVSKTRRQPIRNPNLHTLQQPSLSRRHQCQPPLIVEAALRTLQAGHPPLSYNLYSVKAPVNPTNVHCRRPAPAGRRPLALMIGLRCIKTSLKRKKGKLTGDTSVIYQAGKSCCAILSRR